MDDKGVRYEPVSKNGTAITKALMEIWERIGQPDDFSSQAGRSLLAEIIKVWQYFYRSEYLAASHDNAIDRRFEITLSQMKQGYTPIAYPPTLYQLIKAMFPNVNLSHRKTQKVIQEVAPFLKTTNLRI